MVDEAIVSRVRDYLRALAAQGLAADFAVVFGSWAKGRGDEWSDIDLLVVSERFDAAPSRDDIDCLWRVAARIDSRIEPVPCGVRQWGQDASEPLIEIARREGTCVLPAA